MVFNNIIIICTFYSTFHLKSSKRFTRIDFTNFQMESGGTTMQLLQVI